MWAVKPPERKPSQEEDEIDDDEDNALKVGNLYCVVSRLRVRFLAEKKQDLGLRTSNEGKVLLKEYQIILKLFFLYFDEDNFVVSVTLKENQAN